MKYQTVLLRVADLLEDLSKQPEIQMGFWSEEDEETFVEFKKLVGEFQARRITFVSTSLHHV